MAILQLPNATRCIHLDLDDATIPFSDVTDLLASLAHLEVLALRNIPVYSLRLPSAESPKIFSQMHTMELQFANDIEHIQAAKQYYHETISILFLDYRYPELKVLHFDKPVSTPATVAIPITVKSLVIRRPLAGFPRLPPAQRYGNIKFLSVPVYYGEDSIAFLGRLPGLPLINLETLEVVAQVHYPDIRDFQGYYISSFLSSLREKVQQGGLPRCKKLCWKHLCPEVDVSFTENRLADVAGNVVVSIGGLHYRRLPEPPLNATPGAQIKFSIGHLQVTGSSGNSVADIRNVNGVVDLAGQDVLQAVEKVYKNGFSAFASILGF